MRALNDQPIYGKYAVVNKYDPTLIFFSGTKKQCEQYLAAKANITLTIVKL